MLFNSFEFVGLLALTVLLYYLPFLRRFQIPVLIASSLFFYAYGQPVLVFLLLTSVAINIVSSYLVVYSSGKYKKHFAFGGVVLNLAILLFFKYSPLFSKTFFNPSDSLGHFLLTIPLPVGISFFTFQGISLVVDVYSEKYGRNQDIVPVSFLQHAQRVMFFKGFFPQLVSGPIVKAHDFLPQISRKYFSDIEWEPVFKCVLTGYFLKMVVADNLKDFTFWIEYPYFLKYSSWTLVTILFGYSFQIFADFAGYSLIAIGLAKLFGYHFKDNFNFPYISTSFREFWKRWHISLSTFLMEYLYIPLGGNKKGKVRTYLNLMVVMLLGGLWHGAAWSYAVWGGFHGLALALERFLSGFAKAKAHAIVSILKGMLVFASVTLAWLLFKLPNFKEVVVFLECIITHRKFENNTSIITYTLLYSAPVILYHGFYLAKSKWHLFYFRKFEFIFYGMMLFLIMVNSGLAGTFIYFQF